jgi:hypothetical protein
VRRCAGRRPRSGFGVPPVLPCTAAGGYQAVCCGSRVTGSPPGQELHLHRLRVVRNRSSMVSATDPPTSPRQGPGFSSTSRSVFAVCDGARAVALRGIRALVRPRASASGQGTSGPREPSFPARERKSTRLAYLVTSPFSVLRAAFPTLALRFRQPAEQAQQAASPEQSAGDAGRSACDAPPPGPPSCGWGKGNLPQAAQPWHTLPQPPPSERNAAERTGLLRGAGSSIRRCGQKSRTHPSAPAFPDFCLTPAPGSTMMRLTRGDRNGSCPKPVARSTPRTFPRKRSAGRIQPSGSHSASGSKGGCSPSRSTNERGLAYARAWNPFNLASGCDAGVPMVGKARALRAASRDRCSSW